jgi:putative nucleotidyltransferase with HDIG domain
LSYFAPTRSKETANHVRRVGVIAEMLGRCYGLSDNECAQLKFAAPLHDIGKIGIPDDILNKPGPHTTEETKVMRTHADLGANMLASSRRPLMILASKIAAEHHENWDGSGYPLQLAGEAISIAGRITSLADVFDALGSQRCYKQPWNDADIQNFIRGQSGIKFEPKLVELLIANWDEAQRIRAALPDED